MQIRQYESPILSKYNLRRETNEFFRTKYPALMKILAENDYTIYHLSVTWQNNSQANIETEANKNFSRFYLRNLVPLVIEQSRINKRNLNIQPICVACLDKSKDFVSQRESSMLLPKSHQKCASIHHHCLIAARDIAQINLDKMCGTNTIKQAFKDDLARRKKTSYSETPENNLWTKLCSTDLKNVTAEIQYDYPFKNQCYFEELPLTFNTKQAEEKYLC